MSDNPSHERGLHAWGPEEVLPSVSVSLQLIVIGTYVLNKYLLSEYMPPYALLPKLCPENCECKGQALALRRGMSVRAWSQGGGGDHRIQTHLSLSVDDAGSAKTVPSLPSAAALLPPRVPICRTLLVHHLKPTPKFLRDQRDPESS